MKTKLELLGLGSLMRNIYKMIGGENQSYESYEKKIKVMKENRLCNFCNLNFI